MTQSFYDPEVFTPEIEFDALEEFGPLEVGVRQWAPAAFVRSAAAIAVVGVLSLAFSPVHVTVPKFHPATAVRTSGPPSIERLGLVVATVSPVVALAAGRTRSMFTVVPHDDSGEADAEYDL